MEDVATISITIIAHTGVVVLRHAHCIHHQHHQCRHFVVTVSFVSRPEAIAEWDIRISGKADEYAEKGRGMHRVLFADTANFKWLAGGAHAIFGGDHLEARIRYLAARGHTRTARDVIQTTSE